MAEQYYKNFSSILCHHCKKDTPRSEAIKVRLPKTVLSYCKTCYAARIKREAEHRLRLKQNPL